MTISVSQRWQALDWLRGLSIIGMLLNLTPGAWEHEYTWMTHAKWQGGHLIDMVAPGFLFCIGAALPLSLGRRMAQGQSKAGLWWHGLWRGVLLVLIGLFLNAYPAFDLAHVRIPGVLQKIGLAFILALAVVLSTTRRSPEGTPVFAPRAIAVALAFILLSHWALLEFVPVPGYGAARFDPVGSWASYIDRSLFTVPHMFIYWPVNGKVVFDPDGLLNVYTSAGNILLGVLAGLAYSSGRVKRPVVAFLVAGVALMALGLTLNGICPIIKNIWTSTFVLFSGGFSLVLLAGLSLLAGRPAAGKVLFPLQVYGANPLLAYLICFLFAPVLDLNWAHRPAWASIRSVGDGLFRLGLDPDAASFAFGLTYLGILFVVLWICYRRRWILKL
jgi:predicted acyltransferase